MKIFSAIIFLIFVFSLTAFAQMKTMQKPSPNAQAVRNSPAFAELLLRRTELEAKVEDFLVDYTEEYPKLKEARFELGVITRDLEKLLNVSAAENSKLTLALGKLIVRKAELETDLWALRQQFNDEHPDVKRAMRKVATYEKAVKEIMP